MGQDNTDWKRMSFKGNKVWLHVTADGTPVMKGGKVLIKYQLNQEHEYWVPNTAVRPVEEISPKNNKNNKKQPLAQNDVHDGSQCDTAICVYTDGASSGNPGPSGIGVVLRYKTHKKEISTYIGTATNNIAELEAIRAGLLEVKKRDLPVRIYTDSSYAYGLLTKGWKPKKNMELVGAIKSLMSSFQDLKFVKVRGHVGIADNELADTLATSAIKKETGKPEV